MPVVPCARALVQVCLVGTLIAGATDLTYDPYGYLMAVLTNLSTSLYIVLIRFVKSRAPPSAQLDSFAMLYYNVVLSAVPLVAYSLWRGDWETISNYPHWSSFGFQTVFGQSPHLSRSQCRTDNM
jgi:solute carrier family 35 protein